MKLTSDVRAALRQGEILIYQKAKGFTHVILVYLYGVKASLALTSVLNTFCFIDALQISIRQAYHKFHFRYTCPPHLLIDQNSLRV